MQQGEGPSSYLHLQSLVCEFPLLCKDSDEGVMAQVPCCRSRSSVGVLLSPTLLHDELSPPPDFYVEVLTNSQFLCKVTMLGKRCEGGHCPIRLRSYCNEEDTFKIHATWGSREHQPQLQLLRGGSRLPAKERL